MYIQYLYWTGLVWHKRGTRGLFLWKS